MKIELVKQWDSDSCGPASIIMALRHFNMPHTRKQVSSITNYKKEEGLTNSQLITALRSFNVRVKTKTKIDWNELMALSTPENVLIVSWMLNGYIGHFSVVEKVTQTHIFLADPVIGKVRKMQRLIFLRLWFHFGDRWYPEKNSDIELRWIAIVSKK